MSEEEVFKQRVQRLQEVNAVIAELDPSIRLRAFEILEPYITGSGADAAAAAPNRRGHDAGHELADFFSELEQNEVSPD